MRPLLVILILLLLSCSGNKQDSIQAVSSPFHIADGFEISLFASEPLISDPVAMEVDEYGNMYVVEMHGYPLDKSGSGIIKLLKDTDGDGLPDSSIVFADSLRLPNGIMRWKQGMIVTDVPDVLYLEDLDGDGRADKKEVLITGLALSNPQHNGNTPIYGPDNWIYIAHESSVTPIVYKDEFGDQGSEVRFGNRDKGPRLPANANGRNIRFRPDQSLLEMCSGESQYGHTFDTRGHHFLTSNADHVFHEAIAARYIERNPLLQVAEATVNIPDHGDAAKVFPVTRNPEHQLLTDVGVITSSSGITWYNGGLFPDSFNNVTFIAESVHNLVHADRIKDSGSSFTASRVYHGSEFLASEDPWFRPVQFYIGPDGALYVIDYYRQYIEHPEWMSEEVAKSGALYNGSDKGRIYRIVPKGSAPPEWLGSTELGSETVLKLVSELESRNGWWRRNAQRLLVDRRDPAALPLLKRIVTDAKDPNAVIHALWTLEGMQQTDSLLLLRSMKHTHPWVREVAVKIADDHLDNQSVVTQILSMHGEKDAKVSYQLLCTAGSLGPRATQLRSSLLEQHISDHWFQLAALSAAGGTEWSLLELQVKRNEPASASFVGNCAALVALGEDPREINAMAALIVDGKLSPVIRSSILEGLLNANRVRRLSPSSQKTLSAALRNILIPGTDSLLRDHAVKVYLITNAGGNTLPENIHRDVLNEKMPLAYRRSCLQLMVLTPTTGNKHILKTFISPDKPLPLQEEAARSWMKIDRPGASNELLSVWQSLMPSVRSVVLAESMRNPASMQNVLNAVDSKKLPVSSLPWPMQVSLMNNRDPEIRKRARELLTARTPDRDVALKRFADALRLKGDPGKGDAIFRTSCSPCHQMNGTIGAAFGPDLASIRNRDPRFILEDIIQPQRSIADGFEWWEVTLQSGQKSEGLISTETSSSITLKDPAGNQTVIQRSNIKTITATDRSAMPPGLEQTMSVQQMADLLAFLKK